MLWTLTLLMAAGQWRCTRVESNGTAAAPPAEKAALEVRVEKATVSEWDVVVPFNGSLRSQSIVETKAEVGGRLIATHFEEGDLVHKDQVLAEIDSTNYRLALDQANAALGVATAGLGRAQVVLDHAVREKERADNLLKTGGITERDHQAAATSVKEAESQVRLAEAQCQQARTAISVAEKSLRDCRILAPAEGHVSRKFYDQGSLVTPGTPLYTLVDNSRLELECLLPSYRLAEVRVGQRASFSTPTFGDRVFQGAVSAVNPMVESDNRSVKVLVKVPNPKGELRSGMYAHGEIGIRRDLKAIVIPRSALISEQEASSAGSVYLYQDGVARRREIRIGGIEKDRLWAEKGLEEGAQVIVEIGPTIKEGTAVRIAGNSSGAQR